MMLRMLCLAVSGLLTLATVAQKSVSLDDVWRYYRFSATGIGGLQSMQDGKHYTTKSGGKINKYNYDSGALVEVILNAEELQNQQGKPLSFDSYALSVDEKQVLLATESEPIFRHSTKAVYYVVDLSTKKMRKIADSKVRYATFSPDGSKVAFVDSNNLFYTDVNSGQTTQITFDGEINKIINGATDWVYEEEFSFDRAFFWSPDGQNIAYYRFDETNVPEFSMDIYGNELYPMQDKFKYPKAGEENATVTAHIYSLKNNKSTQVLVDETFEYIPRIKWTQDPNTVVVYAMNRHQNHLILYSVNASNFTHSILFEEKDDAYIEITDDIRFLKDGSFIWSSDRNGYIHLYHITNKGAVKRQITNGTWDVTKFYGINEKTGMLYYQSNEVHVSERNVYSVNINGKNKKLLTPQKGTNNADFSSDFSYYFNSFSNSSTPMQVALNRANGTQIRMVKDNEAVAKRLEGFNISPKEFFMLKTPAGQELSAWMIKPLNFDPEKKYPVLMFVYGGPGNQQVLNQYDGFNSMWYQMLASEGYMVVCVDNRGTGGRGREFRKSTYMQLGKLETEDQIASAQYLASLPYVDGMRIGIWGWSYGGYMSSNCLFQGNEVFKLAIAVAPVTNWRFYDSIYTERYMRTPQENPDGYDKNSPINYAKGLKGKYLLVHGTADDNVHVQNAMRLTEELVQANKQFNYFVYPDKNHGIFGGNTRLHLYKMMTDFIFENL